MVDRSSRVEVRNPVLTLPAMRRIAEQDTISRGDLRELLAEAKTECQARADQCWRRHKAPMASYWKSWAVNLGHMRRALGRAA